VRKYSVVFQKMISDLKSCLFIVVIRLTTTFCVMYALPITISESLLITFLFEKLITIQSIIINSDVAFTYEVMQFIYVVILFRFFYFSSQYFLSL